MTQPSSTFLAAGEDEQSGRPFGFASPVAPPLSVSEQQQSTTPGAVAPPADFAPPSEQIRPLAQIMPAPPERRDPSQPLLDAAPSEEISTWDPSQPVPGSATSSALASALDEDGELSSTQLGALPPPTGAPAGGAANWPVPAPGPGASPMPATGAPNRGAMPGPAPARMPGQPGFPGAPTAGPLPHAQYPTGPSPYPANPYAPGVSPYPVNPYATGAYSQQGYYGVPYGGPQPPAPTSRAANGWLIGLLVLGIFWSGLSPWVLIAAGVLAAIKKLPGRIAVIICAAFTLVVGFFWFEGYFYIDQWQSTAQLLSFIGLAAVFIGLRSSRQRRY